MQEDPVENKDPLETQARDWQRWSFVVFALGLMGVILALYGLLTSPSTTWSSQDAAQLLPPLLYGLFSLLVLLNFYAAEKQAMIRGLKEVLIKQKIEAELNRELALIDPITEVYNRRYLRAILAKEISRVKRYNVELAVMMLDIVGFRRVNESLGQTGGDVVLRQMARVIQTRIRNSDTVVRFGGDEFLLILPDTDDTGVQTLTGRLKESAREWSRRSRMTEFKLAFAIGVARYSSDHAMDSILALAEQRMLQDKQAVEVLAKEVQPAPGAAGASVS